MKVYSVEFETNKGKRLDDRIYSSRAKAIKGAKSLAHVLSKNSMEHINNRIDKEVETCKELKLQTIVLISACFDLEDTFSQHGTDLFVSIRVKEVY